MFATERSAARLETPRPAPIGNGYHSRTLVERLKVADAENEQRDRWLAMWKDADRKPDELYEFTRAADRRAAIADNRQRKLVQRGLADGSISMERYLDYRLWQIETDLKCIPGNGGPLAMLRTVSLSALYIASAGLSSFTFALAGASRHWTWLLLSGGSACAAFVAFRLLRPVTAEAGPDNEPDIVVSIPDDSPLFMADSTWNPRYLRATIHALQRELDRMEER
jgi:hypothetical protein